MSTAARATERSSPRHVLSGLHTEPPPGRKGSASAHHQSYCQQEGLAFPSLHPGVGGVCCADTLRSLTRAALTHPATEARAQEVCDGSDADNHDDTSSPQSAPMTYRGCSKHFTGIRFQGCYCCLLFIDEKTNPREVKSLVHLALERYTHWPRCEESPWMKRKRTPGTAL